MPIRNYHTLSSLTSQRYRQGYKHTYKRKGDVLACIETGKTYRPDEMKIVAEHRFEGNSNPADMSIVFVVQCHDGSKGMIITSFGTYANTDLMDFMDRVPYGDKARVDKTFPGVH